MPPPVQSEQTIARWMIHGFVWSLLVAILALGVLTLSFGVPARLGMQPAIVLSVCLLFFCVAMFFARRRFQRSRDLKFGIFVSGLFCLVTGFLGMGYAGSLG